MLHVMFTVEWYGYHSSWMFSRESHLVLRLTVDVSVLEEGVAGPTAAQPRIVAFTTSARWFMCEDITKVHSIALISPENVYGSSCGWSTNHSHVACPEEELICIDGDFND